MRVSPSRLLAGALLAAVAPACGRLHRAPPPAAPALLPAAIPAAAGPVRTLFAMRYVDLVSGGGAPAEAGQVYAVHYTGWLAGTGTKFDSSRDRGEPIKFEQGKRRVIAGWDAGFEGMRVGGRRRLIIPYQLAYGERGRGPIPGRADLVFDVELVAVSPAPPEPARAR